MLLPLLKLFACKPFRLCAAVLLALTFSLPAGARQWVADPARSRLEFTATQEGAKFKGDFSDYKVALNFDFDNMSAASLRTYIKLDSVNTRNDERDKYLQQRDWFYVAMFPEATFISNSIRLGPQQGYVARGKLTLRGVTGDVELHFDLDFNERGDQARLKGTARVKRLDYGVGQGDWSNTDWIGDPVDIEVDLFLVPPAVRGAK